MRTLKLRAWPRLAPGASETQTEGVSMDACGSKADPNAQAVARRKFKAGMNSDGEIKQAVLVSLRLDPRVRDFSPDVTVADAAVILGGSVGNLKAKTAAEQDANNIVGIWQVDNPLEVRPKTWPSEADKDAQKSGATVVRSRLRVT